jgi:hypothetical protein
MPMTIRLASTLAIGLELAADPDLWSIHVRFRE